MKCKTAEEEKRVVQWFFSLDHRRIFWNHPDIRSTLVMNLAVKWAQHPIPLRRKKRIIYENMNLYTKNIIISYS